MNWGMLQVTLYVAEVVKSVEFYQSVLGLDFRGYWDPGSESIVEKWEHRDPPGYAEVRAGSNRVIL